MASPVQKVTVVCATSFCTNFVETTNIAHLRLRGMSYCERCRKEHRRIQDAEYHKRNKEARNARKRELYEYEPQPELPHFRGHSRHKPKSPPEPKKLTPENDRRVVLTEEQVEEIRQRLEEDTSWGIGLRLAREYGVSSTHIYDIRDRKKRQYAG